MSYSWDNACRFPSTTTLACLLIFSFLCSNFPTRPCLPDPSRFKDKDESKIRKFVSDHEHPKSIPTKLKITGDLATPAPQSHIKLPFIPKQTYAQVRSYDTVVHLPRSAALSEARTDEEILNAPRLREVIAQSKKQEVYEEKGYEDAGYDHGGYKKGFDYHEKTRPNDVLSSNTASSDNFSNKLSHPKFSSSRLSATSAPHSQDDVNRSKRDSVQSESEETVLVTLSGSTTQIPVDLKKYPFYKAVSSDSLGKYSVLRYITNPRDIPIKNGQKMSFYESRNRIQCSDLQPQNIVTNEEPQPNLSRIRLGDQINCLRMKFFGENPLDNPFFKEDSVGIPEIFVHPAAESIQSPQPLQNVTEAFSLPSLNKSPVRKWIESLAEPRYPPNVQKLSKRSTIEGETSPEDDNNKRQKVFFVGGFLNRGSPQSFTTSNSTSHHLQSSSDEIGFAPELLSSESDVGNNLFQNEAFVGINKIPKDSQYLPLSPRIMNRPAGTKQYVDATNSLRNLQNSSKYRQTPLPEHISPLKLEYKEPTWRGKSKTSTSHEMDSLLYVIDPKTGEGRWMRLLKIEEVDDSAISDSFKKTPRPTRYSEMKDSPEDTNSDYQGQQAPCLEDGVAESSKYETHHINDLINQLAPLKANEIEINSLMSPRLADSVTDPQDESEDEDLSDDSYTYLGLENSTFLTNSNTTPRFADPHERLYYYVIDK